MANNQSVRRHLDAFTRGRIIGKLEEGRSVTRTAIQGFSSGRPRGTTPADDRYIVFPEETGGRQWEKLDTRHRRLDDRYRVLPWPEERWWSVCTTPCTVCTFNACPSEKAFSVVPGTTELKRQ
ncbi:hypothetical protein TNCV_2193871 [Trichonephila clavipes]|uniref:Uncharacterized protein n=1 Tax=Trichonephila clavipes TaxID=2585209 RepID=A0A8X6SLJ6_TRICX|nr:hypothetical protein TNCV_2193871 [Trichonephila clavipes]